MALKRQKFHISTELDAAAQECFKEMCVALKWTNLYKKESDVPNTTSGMSETLQECTVDKLNRIIDTFLPTFSQHRNITAVYPSFKVTNSKQTGTPCIMINVVGKGRIPISESEIPKFVDSYPVDIVEGFWIETYNLPNPNKLQEEMDRLRLGASISIEGADAGSLGAILRDDDGKFYLLSCKHVIGTGEKNEIIHPGRLHYLELLKHYLAKYKTYLNSIIGFKRSLTLSGEKPPELKLLEEFRQLQKDSDEVNYSKLPRSVKFSRDYEDFIRCAQKLEELFKHPPRVVADLSVSFSGNVCVSDQREYGIDAGVAELREEEVKALSGNSLFEMIGTTDYPSGSVMMSNGVLGNVSTWCKSGSATGYTSVKSYLDLVHVNLKHSPNQELVVHLDPQRNEFSSTRKLVQWRKCLSLKKSSKEKELFAGEGDSGTVVFKKCQGAESMSGIGIVSGGHYEARPHGIEHCGTFVSPLDISLKILSLSLKKKFFCS